MTTEPKTVMRIAPAETGSMARDRFLSDDPRAPYKVIQGEEDRGTYKTRAEARRRQQQIQIERLATSDAGFRTERAALRRKAMSDLLLKHIGRRGEEYYDVIADGQVVGRIMMFADTPAGKPWMWSLYHGQDEDRTPTHGYEPTREAALQAFAKSWHRE